MIDPLDELDLSWMRVRRGAVSAATRELGVACRKFGPFASAHEGLAVLEEEVDELKKEVRDNKRPPAEYRAAMRREAVQVAAMALRFIVDVCDRERVHIDIDQKPRVP